MAVKLCFVKLELNILILSKKLIYCDRIIVGGKIEVKNDRVKF